jgi:hypothetical protein
LGKTAAVKLGTSAVRREVPAGTFLLALTALSLALTAYLVG